MIRLSIIGLIVVLLGSCTPEVQPIDFGNDECSFCKMAIVDQRYGAELLTTKGKVFKYDAIECLVNAMCENSHNEAVNFHSAYFIDFLNPGSLTPASSGAVLFSKAMPSPMGAFLTGFSSGDSAQSMQIRNGGDIYDWEGVYSKIIGDRKCQNEP